MAKKSLLLIESGRFIGGVIRNLLTTYGELDIIEASPANRRELIKVVEECHPEIIVLDDTVGVDYLTHLLKYMQKSEGIQVVVVNTDSNQVEVYQKQQIAVNQTADFFAIL